MPKSITDKRKKRGRPATGLTPYIGMRLPAKLLAAIDAWQEEHSIVTRSEAIRRLVEQALSANAQRSPKSALKASDMAAQQIDKMADSSATDEERHTRKRRLLKGPEGFRDMRGNHPKPKR